MMCTYIWGVLMIRICGLRQRMVYRIRGRHELLPTASSVPQDIHGVHTYTQRPLAFGSCFPGSVRHEQLLTA